MQVGNRLRQEELSSLVMSAQRNKLDGFCIKTRTVPKSHMANLLLSVMGAFAEFERALIRERQREGIALAHITVC